MPRPHDKAHKPRRPKPGRPTQYRAHLADRAGTLAADGMTNREIATGLSVSEPTFYAWIALHPKFAEAIKAGQRFWTAHATSNVKRKLYERATGYEHPAVHFSAHEGDVTATPYTARYAPDTGAAKYWLNNQDPENWKDRQSVEHTVDLRFAERLRQARERVDALNATRRREK